MIMRAVTTHELPTGDTLIVHGFGESGWHLQIGDREIIGLPLNSTLAELLGFRLGQEEWPAWIDRIADQIADG
jgi:hypothetical protein